ncbi:MAG: glycosyltransferase, partial [Crenarchaeota archaeon]|nr:glycosyltransferase [Thermoproteota archaeon]
MISEISVVISTYSIAMKDNVLDCIKSLKKQTFLPKEILLVLDNDPHLLQFFKSIVPVDVRVLSSKGFGL